MVFDFAARPPEVNSTSMYSGAGAGPMMAAASTFGEPEFGAEQQRDRLRVGHRRSSPARNGRDRQRPRLPPRLSRTSSG